MRCFKKAIAMTIATAVLFIGLNAIENEDVQEAQGREPEPTIVEETAISPVPEPTKTPELEPQPAARIYDIPLAEKLQEYTFNLCEDNNLDYEMVLAIMDQESDYQEKVISKTNDY